MLCCSNVLHLLVLFFLFTFSIGVQRCQGASGPIVLFSGPNYSYDVWSATSFDITAMLVPYYDSYGRKVVECCSDDGYCRKQYYGAHNYQPPGCSSPCSPSECGSYCYGAKFIGEKFDTEWEKREFAKLLLEGDTQLNGFSSFPRNIISITIDNSSDTIAIATVTLAGSADFLPNSTTYIGKYINRYSFSTYVDQDTSRYSCSSLDYGSSFGVSRSYPSADTAREFTTAQICEASLVWELELKNVKINYAFTPDLEATALSVLPRWNTTFTNRTDEIKRLIRRFVSIRLENSDEYLSFIVQKKKAPVNTIVITLKNINLVDPDRIDSSSRKTLEFSFSTRVEVRFLTRSGAQMHANAVWEGSEYFDIFVEGNADAVAWNVGKISLNQADFLTAFEEVEPVAPNGFAALRPAVLDLDFSNEAIIRVRLKKYGFVIEKEITLDVNTSKLLQYALPLKSDYCGYVAGPGLKILPGDSGSYAMVSQEGYNEFDVRNLGINLTISLRYNLFNTSFVPDVVCSDPSISGVATGDWIVSYSEHDSVLVLTLLPVQSFDISSDVTFTVFLQSNDMNSTIVPGLQNKFFQIVIETIDNLPVAFCRVYNTSSGNGTIVASVNEEELRNGNITLFIVLVPHNTDFFVNESSTAVQIKDSVRTLPGIEVEVVTVDPTYVEIMLVAIEGANFNLAEPGDITLNPSYSSLRSGECGCGSVMISVEMTSGVVVGTNFQVELSELDFNTHDTQFNMLLDFDSFVPSNESLIITFQRYPEDYNGAASLVGMEIIIPTIRWEVTEEEMIVTVPKNERYNIPGSVYETITIEIPASFLRSRIAPKVVNTTATIRPAEPRIVCSIKGARPVVDAVRAEEMWIGNATLLLSIEGDEWNVDGANLWNPNHPQFLSTTVDGRSFGFTRFVESTEPIRYDEVSLTSRLASLPLGVYEGISLDYNDRVIVGEVSQLVRGRPTIRSSSFVIQKVQPKNIEVEFEGRWTYTESEVRHGLWFLINLTYEVFAENVLEYHSLRKLFPSSPTRLLSPYLPSNLHGELKKDFVLNVSLNGSSDLQQLDIIKQTQVLITIHPDLFRVTKPFRTFEKVLSILPNESPECFFYGKHGRVELTESEIREGKAIVLMTTDVWKLDNSSGDPLLSIVRGLNFNRTSCPTSTASPDEGMDLLCLLVSGGASYDIYQDQIYNMYFSRAFFKSGERCSSSMSMKVNVEPGQATVLTSSISEESIRSSNASVQVRVTGEKVEGENFTVLAELASKHSFEISNSTKGIPRNLTAVTNLTADPEIFEISLPRLPHFNVDEPVFYIHFWLPANITSTAVNLVNPNVSIDLAPSQLVVYHTNSTNEHDLSRGSFYLNISVESDQWNLIAAREKIIDFFLWEDQDSRAAATDMLQKGAFSLEQNTKGLMQTLVVRFGDVEYFDMIAPTNFTVTIPGECLLSGLVPFPNSFSVSVENITGLLAAEGPAKFTGSRRFVSGPVLMFIVAEDDLFVKSKLAARTVCPPEALLQCQIAPQELPSKPGFVRNLTVEFLQTTSVVVVENTTFNINIPAEAMASGNKLNNASFYVYVEGGEVQFSFVTPAPYIGESLVREGRLPVIRIEIGGDRLTADISRLVKSLAETATCEPPSDVYGFCSLFPHLLVSQAVTFTPSAGRQIALLRLQAETSFDIFGDETVHIGLNGKGVDSGMAPTGTWSFKVLAAPGQYFASISRFEIWATQLAFRDLSQKLEITFTLYGERFIEEPLPRLLESIRSLSTASSLPTGFERFKDKMISLKSFSQDRHTLTLVIESWSQYFVERDETITFSVAGRAVKSGKDLSAVSVKNSVLVRACSRVWLSIEGPATASGARKGFKLLLSSSDIWDGLLISGADLTSTVLASLQPQSIPLHEPSGFAANHAKFKVISLSIDQRINNCTIAVQFDPLYKLRRKETILFALPQDWLLKRLPLYPEAVGFDILPDTVNLVAVVADFTSEEEWQACLASYVGVTSNQFVITDKLPYGDSEAKYTNIGFHMVDGHGPPYRDAYEATTFLLNTPQSVLEKICNIPFLYDLASPPDLLTVNRTLGLNSAGGRSIEDAPLWWVYLLVAFVLVVLIVAALYYYYCYKSTVDAGSNRELPASRLNELMLMDEIKAQESMAGKNEEKPAATLIEDDHLELLLCATQSNPRPLEIPSLEMRKRMAKQLALEQEREERHGTEGYPVLAVRSGMKVDVDDQLHRGQPAGFVPAPFPVFESALTDELRHADKDEEEGIRSVYPPNTKMGERPKPTRVFKKVDFESI